MYQPIPIFIRCVGLGDLSHAQNVVRWLVVHYQSIKANPPIWGALHVLIVGVPNYTTLTSYSVRILLSATTNYLLAVHPQLWYEITLKILCRSRGCLSTLGILNVIPCTKHKNMWPTHVVTGREGWHFWILNFGSNTTTTRWILSILSNMKIHERVGWYFGSPISADSTPLCHSTHTPDVSSLRLSSPLNAKWAIL